MSTHDEEVVREAVRQRYAGFAAAESSCCTPAPTSPSCCSGGESATEDDVSRALGYSDEELAAVPDGANLGLGCGNPQAIAALKPGEVLIDLGSGDAAIAVAHQFLDVGVGVRVGCHADLLFRFGVQDCAARPQQFSVR